MELSLLAIVNNWKEELTMCAIICYWRGKRQIRFVKSETVNTVCADLEKRGFTRIEIGGVMYE